ncbi:MAG: hypothetical protein QM692_21040 [Thermomicrobiales bacterium]
MENERFDAMTARLTRRLTRRRGLGVLAALGLAGAAAGGAEAKKKKKKKTCAKKCKSGCCTGKKGKCIKPNAQSLTQCGTGGEICRSTNCGCLSGTACPAGQCCTATGACGACTVFATNAATTGALGGLSGADATCQSAAAAAGLTGTFKAWLSDATGSPSTRFTKATAAYQLVDGTEVAQNYTDLTSGNLRHAIDKTETGTVVVMLTPDAWTNTATNGTVKNAAGALSCVAWTVGSNAQSGWQGRPTIADSNWTDFNFSGCDIAHRLYCFQQP